METVAMRQGTKTEWTVSFINETWKNFSKFSNLPLCKIRKFGNAGSLSNFSLLDQLGEAWKQISRRQATTTEWISFIWTEASKRFTRFSSFRIYHQGHLSLISMSLTAMCVTINGVSSHLCKILTPIIVKTYLQTRWRRYRIAPRTVVSPTLQLCKSSWNFPKSVRKRPKTHSFLHDTQVEIAFIIEIMPIFQLEHPYSFSLACFK